MITSRSWAYIGGCAACLLLICLLFRAVTAKNAFNTHFRAGYECLLKGDFDGSLDHFDEIMSSHPSRSGIASLSAAASFYAGRYARARELFSSADPSPAVKTGRLLCDVMLRVRKERKGKGPASAFDPASLEERLRRIAPDDPNVAANVLGVRAWAGERKGDVVEDSLRLFDEKIKGNPAVEPFPLALAYNARGCLLASAGRFAEAAVDFRRAALFMPARETRTLLERNGAAVRFLRAVAPGCRKKDLVGLKKEMRFLKKEDRPFALLALAAAYLRVGALDEGKKIIDSFRPSSPSLAEKLDAVKMQFYRYAGLRGARARKQAYPNLVLLIEKKLEAVKKGGMKPGENLRAMIYFLAGYYHAHRDDTREAELLETASGLYPGDFSFLRNRGILLVRNGRFAEGCRLLRRSLELNPGQKDLEDFLRGLSSAALSLERVHVFTGEPFSHRRPLVHVAFRRESSLQPPPVVTRVLLGGIPLRYVVAGDALLARPVEPLPEGFSRYTVSVETAERGNGKKRRVLTMTADQDLGLPVIRIASPARNAVVSQFSFTLELTVSDAGSGIDLSSLVVSVRAVSEGRRGFRFFVVKDGVYRKVRKKRGKKVDGSGHVKALVPLPVPGKYELYVSVEDRAHNRRRIEGWTFKAR